MACYMMHITWNACKMQTKYKTKHFWLKCKLPAKPHSVSLSANCHLFDAKIFYSAVAFGRTLLYNKKSYC